MAQVESKVRVSSKLNTKRVVAYFKKSGVDVHVERVGESVLSITNTFALVRVQQHPDIPYTFFSAEWARATFSGGKEPAIENSRPDQQRFWDQHEVGTYHSLTLTHELREVSGDKKGGVLWRRFTYEDTQLVTRTTYLNKQICDMLSPDLDELEGFLFEQIGVGAVRVSDASGHIAILMPGYNVESK